MTKEAQTTSTPSTPTWTIGLTPEMVSKQQEFYNVRVRHPAMVQLLDDLVPLLMPHSESNIIVVTGATGVGKSTVSGGLLNSLLKDFLPLMQQDKGCIPHFRVEAYANGDVQHSFKDLYFNMLKELQEPTDDRKVPSQIQGGKMVMSPLKRDTVPGLRLALENALKARSTRVGVIDEAAHLLRFSKKAVVMDTLKSLANTTGVKWVLVGSFDLFDLIVENGQVARRSTILNLERYRSDKAADRAAFRKVVEALQARWPSEEVPNFAAISDELMEVSLGCIGLLKSLLLDASAMQLRNHGKWKSDFLMKAAKSSKMYQVISREIEVGEEKVKSALYGNSPWTPHAFDAMVSKMGAASKTGAAHA